MDRTACITQDGEDRESMPGQYIRGISNGCIAGYRYFEGENLQDIQVIVRGRARGTLYVTCQEEGDVDTDPEKTASGSVKIALNIAEWTAVTIPVRIPGGVYPVYFRFRGEGKMDLLEFTLE